jgi:hypothetical protein
MLLKVNIALDWTLHRAISSKSLKEDRSFFIPCLLYNCASSIRLDFTKRSDAIWSERYILVFVSHPANNKRSFHFTLLYTFHVKSVLSS